MESNETRKAEEKRDNICENDMSGSDDVGDAVGERGCENGCGKEITRDETRVISTQVLLVVVIHKCSILGRFRENGIKILMDSVQTVALQPVAINGIRSDTHQRTNYSPRYLV